MRSFVLRRKTAKSKFVRVPQTVQTRQLVSQLKHSWRLNALPPPGAILRITGGPENLPLTMVDGVNDGVVHAAGLCKAWTLTNGLDHGVVSAVGGVASRMVRTACRLTAGGPPRPDATGGEPRV